MAIWELLVIVAGMALTFWLFLTELDDFELGDPGDWIGVIGIGLGGLSVVGPPLLLIRGGRRRGRDGRPRRRWGPGRILWFSHGAAAWLMWPPIVVARARQPAGAGPGGIQVDLPQICYFYGTPLMALYVVAALVAGGWLRPRRRRHRKVAVDWRERFGLALGLAWFALGLAVLALIYTERLR